MQKLFATLPWVQHTNVYEVNIRQYTPEGTLAAFGQSLPRLREMGVETLWFMPVTPISFLNRKGTLGSYYACSDYASINPEYGTLEDFKVIVQEAHGLGMKVIIDWVANHTGYDHHWTLEHPDFYKRNEQGQFYDKYGWDDVIDLDYDNAAMRHAMIGCMKFWVDACGIDGFRCDMAMLVPLDFWEQAREALDAVRPLFWMGELDQADNPEYLQVFDTAYSWKWMHAAQNFYQQHQDISYLDSILHFYNVLPPADTIRLFFTSNHDENSWNGTEYEKYGDMASSLAVFSCTWNGIPMLYSGQEQPSYKRLQFFDKDSIEWGGVPVLQEFYRQLLTLHTSHPALAAGDAAVTTYRLHTSADDRIFAFLRKRDDRAVLVLLNWSGGDVAFQLVDEWATGSFRNVFADRVEELTMERDFQLGPWGYMVMEK